MKLDDTKRRWIIVGIALVLIMFGVLQGAFKIKMNMEVVNQVSFILMMIAAWLLFSGKRTAQNQTESAPETGEPPAEDPARASETDGEAASVEAASDEMKKDE